MHAYCHCNKCCIFFFSPAGEDSQASSWLLAIDQTPLVVSTNLQSSIVGICCLFAAFYLFNIEYTADAMATLDFMQR